MSRGHTQGFDSNAGQFARMGNPWDGEPVLKKRAKKARRKAGIRPCRPGPVRLRPRESREGCDLVEAAQERQFLLRLAAAHRGSLAHGNGQPKSPTLAKPAPYTAHVKPARDAELSEWHPARIADDMARLARQSRSERVQAKQGLGDYKAAAELALDGPLAL